MSFAGNIFAKVSKCIVFPSYRITEKLKRLLYFPLLYEIFMCNFIIALTVFDTISVKSIFSVIFLSKVQLAMCAFVALFISTQKGEELIRESELVRERIYRSKWFMLRREVGEEKAFKSIRSLLVVNMMNAKGKVIIAGGFYTMRFETYTNVSRKFTTRLINRFDPFGCFPDSFLQLLTSHVPHENPEVNVQGL